MKKLIFVLIVFMIIPFQSVTASDDFEYSTLTIWEMRSKSLLKINNGIIIVFETLNHPKIYIEKASTEIPRIDYILSFAIEDFLKRRNSPHLSKTNNFQYSFIHLISDLGSGGWKLIHTQTIDSSDETNSVIRTIYYFIRKNN